MSMVVSMADASYCESKAVELVMEGKSILSHKEKELDAAHRLKMDREYHEKLMQAMSLLALARAMRLENGPL